MKRSTTFLKPFTGTKGKKVTSRFGVTKGGGFGRVGKKAARPKAKRK